MNQIAIKRKTYDLGTMIPFILMHLAALLAFTVPFKWSLVGWAVASYYLRMFGVTGGYHRYFSHRAYKTNRFWQFVLACLAQTSGQKGILWWAAHHRAHHLNSDRKEDLHSPVHEGFWWSHLGWILSDEYDDYDRRKIADFSKYPELRFLDKFHLTPTVVYGAAFYFLGGWDVFVWGFLVSTVALYHGTFLINSMSHIWGSRRFPTPDESRNNWLLAIVTLGEGWHNNHHHYMSSVRQGIKWWEIDVTFYVLSILSWVGITRDLREFRVTATAGDEPAV
jgi:stearoyl-CoA desaturase (delta-9 desaturase)